MTSARALTSSVLQRAALLMLLAWLPGLSYFGHWSTLTAPTGVMPAAVTHQHEDHAAHCHVSVASCSGEQGGAPAPASADALATLRVPAPAHRTAFASADVAHADWTTSPSTPPPRAA